MADAVFANHVLPGVLLLQLLHLAATMWLILIVVHVASAMWIGCYPVLHLAKMAPSGHGCADGPFVDGAD